MKFSTFLLTSFVNNIIVLTSSVLGTKHVASTSNDQFFNSTMLNPYSKTLKKSETISTNNSKTKDSFRPTSWDKNSIDHGSPCKIQPYSESKKFFSKQILSNRYNFMYLKLNFFKNYSVPADVEETKYVINRLDWIWTYKGEYGAHQYLFLPRDFGYLSFGLLWSHTRTENMDINFLTSGNCTNLRIGTNETDELIGNALGNMTSEIAAIHGVYNYSYWCYNYRVWLRSQYLYWLCRNSICTFQTFEYRCCKYVVHLNQTREVQCASEHFLFGSLWWMLPIIVGNLLFAFYPIVLVKVGLRFSHWTDSVKKRPVLPTSLKTFTRSTSEDHMDKKYNFVSLKGDFPITFMSTILSPLCHRNCSGPIVSRILRLWMLLVPISICTTRVLLDNTYAHDLIKGTVEKGGLYSFSSLIAGIGNANKVFLTLVYGPIPGILIFVLFGGALVLFPKRIDEFLEKGLRDGRTRYVFLFQLPLKLIERFSGVSVRKTSGYKRLYALYIAQTFMLLHWKFWRHVAKLFYTRWTNVICPVFALSDRWFFLSIILYAFMFPFYLLFSVIELIIAALYFMFPVINSIFLVLKATLVEYFALFKACGIFLKCVRLILLFPLLGLSLISWYMYCIIFFDAFWFMSKIAMLTYAGIIAYPKISYGYMVLSLMSIYYLVESAHAFGENYRELLKISIGVVEKVYKEVCDDEDLDMARYNAFVDKQGLHRDLFLLIVDRHLPRRNQIMITLLKFGSIITLLTISVVLLIFFDKIQDLSLVTHVFTVLFVCALPKLVRILFMKNHKTETKRRLKSKIRKTFLWFLKHCDTDMSSDEYEFSRNGYNSIDSYDELSECN